MSQNFNQPIQTGYDRYQGPGVVGQIARPAIPYFFDVAKSAIEGETLSPGQTVLRLPSGEWGLVVTDGNTGTHVLGFEQTGLNVAGVFTGSNQHAGIAYAVGDVAKGMIQGSMFLLSKEAIPFNSYVKWDPAQGGYVVLPANATRAAATIAIRALTQATGTDQLFVAYIQPNLPAA